MGEAASGVTPYLPDSVVFRHACPERPICVSSAPAPLAPLPSPFSLLPSPFSPLPDRARHPLGPFPYFPTFPRPPFGTFPIPDPSGLPAPPFHPFHHFHPFHPSPRRDGPEARRFAWERTSAAPPRLPWRFFPTLAVLPFEAFHLSDGWQIGEWDGWTRLMGARLRFPSPPPPLLPPSIPIWSISPSVWTMVTAKPLTYPMRAMGGETKPQCDSECD
jgi:hypothetical protein